MSEEEKVLNRDKVEEDCEGECRDRVNEGRAERQENIEKDKSEKDTTEEVPNAPGAKKRKEQPGPLGGKV